MAEAPDLGELGARTVRLERRAIRASMVWLAGLTLMGGTVTTIGVVALRQLAHSQAENHRLLTDQVVRLQKGPDMQNRLIETLTRQSDALAGQVRDLCGIRAGCAPVLIPLMPVAPAPSRPVPRSTTTATTARAPATTGVAPGPVTTSASPARSSSASRLATRGRTPRTTGPVARSRASSSDAPASSRSRRWDTRRPGRRRDPDTGRHR